MPFDPNWPPTGAELESAPFRAQFNGLKELIDAVPAGPEGPQGIQGPAGPPFASAVVDAVFTVPFGDPAQVIASFDGASVHFTFHLPQGAPGPAGSPGEVTQTILDTAILGTSPNTNGIATLDTPFANDPLSLADGELLRAKLNEIILNGRR